MSGQMSFFDGAKPLKIAKPVRLIELFAGIGAQAKALERLNIPFEHYRICEFDKYAVASYNAVHGTNFAPSDITKISANDLGIERTDEYCYIMTYSFPCTDLSKAGNQKGMSRDSGTRSGLLWQVERLLKECTELPQILLMENVTDLLSDKFVKDFGEWIAFLDSLGYTSKYQVMNAKNFGIPQNRDRCFMVSWLGDYFFDFPNPIKLEKRMGDLMESGVDEKYYLGIEKLSILEIEGGAVRVKEANKDGFTEVSEGDSINLAYPNSKTRRGRVGHQVAQTLTSQSNEQCVIVQTGGGIAKTVRCGGRNTTDHNHTWDLYLESGQEDRANERNSLDIDGKGL